jgi:hypothetical protein
MPIWQPSDAHRLRQLRIAQGLDTFALASRCALSERQLLELEGTGEGGFYSEAIKYQTGLKVLRYLGDDATVDALPRGASTLHHAGRKPATLQPLQVAPPADNHQLLFSIGLALAVCGALISCVNVLDGLGLRPGGLLLTLIGIGMMLFVHQGHNTWAVMLLCVGLLVMNALSALVIRGLGNVSWLAVPVAIMAAGWFMGRTVAWLIALMGMLEAMALYVLHVRGYSFAMDVPAETMLAALVAACAVTALIGGAISQTYGRQFELISESRAELLAVMDSTRAMIWSVSAQDFSLRTFNRVLEKEIQAQWAVPLSLGQLPDAMFGSAARGERWVALYTKALENQGLALEEALFEDGRRFDISFQPIRRNNQTLGVSVYAQDMGGWPARRESNPRPTA